LCKDFEKLGKQIQKAANVIQKEGIPQFIIACLFQLEEAVKNTQENKSKSKMNASNAKSFNAMRQRLKKFNKDYEKKIEDYRKVNSTGFFFSIRTI
jgi:translation initiation factor 3 subunit C